MSRRDLITELSERTGQSRATINGKLAFLNRALKHIDVILAYFEIKAEMMSSLKELESSQVSDSELTIENA